MRYNTSGSCNKAAPPPCRLTCLAGQPKFKSTPSHPIPATRAALSAKQWGSDPNNCGRTDTPAGVRPPLSNSGTTRKKARSGSRVLVTRINSETQRSTPPMRVNTSRRTQSSSPSMGARMITGVARVGYFLLGGKSVQLPCATSAAIPMLSPSVG